MKSLTVVAIVFAGLVSACSSEQQSARDRSDQQVNLAQSSPRTGPSVNPSNQQRLITGTPLVGLAANRDRGRRTELISAKRLRLIGPGRRPRANANHRPQSAAQAVLPDRTSAHHARPWTLTPLRRLQRSLIATHGD